LVGYSRGVIIANISIECSTRQRSKILGQLRMQTRE
jgi:hypothetical protein